MKKVIIVTEFVSMPGEKSNGRFRYIADMLVTENLEIELITTNYSHRDKKHRFFNQKENNSKYKFTMLEEPGYRRNVSLKRFYSHYKFSKNLEKYLEKMEKKPDLIYCAVPTLDAAKVTAKYCQKNNIQFVIDIQDLWPEAFKMIFNVPVISNIIFFPMKMMANYIYKTADDIVAVSETYLRRACKVNTKAHKKEVVFLGTDLAEFDSYRKNKSDKEYNIVKIVYVGTLSYSYDIKKIIDAIKILNDKKIKNIEFVIMGDGLLKEEFEKYAKEKNVNCKFLGRLPYQEMVHELCLCDIAVNPIRSNSAASIINKVGDYAAAGLPVINTQESEEYKNIVEKYHIGYNCVNADEFDIANKIEIMIKNRKNRIEMGKNNRKLAEEKFNRKETYQRIIKIIEEE